jgi:hypothetical protein
MINPERLSGPVDSLNNTIDEIFEEHLVIAESIEADNPTVSAMTLAGWLNGYHPEHSVDVELVTCLSDDSEQARILRTAYFYDTNQCVAEYIISKQQVLDVEHNYQPLDTSQINDLSFWLNETRWNERYTKYYASESA